MFFFVLRLFYSEGEKEVVYAMAILLLKYLIFDEWCVACTDVCG